MGSLIQDISEIFSDKQIIFLVDGHFSGDWDDNVEFITKGDQKVYSIAAASIVAKVERDMWMAEQAKVFPDYDFENNVGYGTRKHIEALQKCGICPIHRRSYKPIKKLLEQKTK